MPVHSPGRRVKVRPRKSHRSASPVAHAGAGVFHLHREVAQLGRRRQQEIHLALFRRCFQALDGVVRVEPVARLRALRAHAGAHVFQLGAQEALPPPFGLPGDLLAQGARLEVGGVIPRMRPCAAVGQLHDARGDVLEEVAIVRDEDHRAGEGAQEFLQPRDGRGVEMIGRLVEQQQVRLPGERAAERHAALLAARERADRCIERRRAQSVGLGANAGVEVPAVGVLDAVEHVGQLVLGALAGFVAAEPFHDVGGAGFDVLADRLPILQLELLRQVAHAQAAAARDLARVRPERPGEDLEERGLARAVASDEADLLTRRDRQAHALEEPLLAEAQRKSVRR